MDNLQPTQPKKPIITNEKLTRDGSILIEPSYNYETRNEDNTTKEKRSVYKASLSSEQTVDRWFGKEKLIHESGAVKLGRAKNKGLPLLFNHNSDEPIGIIKNIKISEDKRLVGNLIFGNSQRAKEIEADVKDGLLDGVSIGYRVLNMTPDEKNTDTYNVDKWELLEASIAPVPADNTVGVGRSMHYQSSPLIETTSSILTSNSGTGVYYPGYLPSDSTTQTTPRYYTGVSYQDPYQRIYQTTVMPTTLEELNEAQAVDDSSDSATDKRTEIDSSNETVKGNKTMTTETQQIDIQAVQLEARNAETQRIKSISSFGKKFNREKEADDFISEGKSVEEFRQYLLDNINPNPQPIAKPNDSEIGLTDREVRQFSFARALAYLAEPQNKRMAERAAFEIECSRAAEQKLGKPSSGIIVPNKRDWLITSRGNGQQVYPDMGERAMSFNIPHDVLTRDLSAGTATDGAELVRTDLLAGSFIDVLRNMLVVEAAGATTLTDLMGDVAIPRQTSGMTGAWISTEGGNASQVDPQFDQVSLTPRTCGVYTEFTRQLLLQSSIDIEAFIRRDLAAGMATTIDLAALYGSGASGQPTGVINTSGITTVTAFAGANPTFAEVITLETALDTSNALLGSMSYILKANMKGVLKSTEKATNTAQFVYESDNTMNGYNAYVTNQLTDGDLFFANWADLILGFWSGLSLLVDPYTNSLSGTIRVVGHQSVDVAVRHPESFAYGT